MALVTNLGRTALDLLLPPHCAVCDERIASAGQLCAACFAATNFIAEPCCQRCGLPFPFEGVGPICRACDANPPLYRQARGGFTYDRQGRRLIIPFKHGDRPELARVLAPHLARAGSDLLSRANVLVPVPLHRRRLFSRRYNQAALLAVALSRLTGVPVQRDALIRVRATASLGRSSVGERQHEVEGAFEVRASREAWIDGSNVLLIDDVMTSGATANACAEALLVANALGVDVLVAARVPPSRTWEA